MKYWQIFKITLEEYFVYRLNFLLWRFRSVVQLLVLYFLWQAAIPQGTTIFGYDQAKILTYILGTSIIRSFVLSARSVDVASEIATGDLANFLLKPVSYFRYWFTKDAADKILNLLFSVGEISLIVILLKPPLLKTSPPFLLLTFLAITMGILLYFYLSFLISMLAFWTPESYWSPRFLFMIVLEFFAGGLFPLDILPKGFFHGLNLLPFPYLLFFPLNIYLGKVSLWGIFLGFLVGIFWTVVLARAVQLAFRAGVKNYAAWGR